MKRNAQVAIALICMILGIMLGVQFKAQEGMGKGISVQRSEALATLLYQVEKERDVLKEEVAELRSKLAEATIGKNLLQNLRSELEKAQVAAGLCAVRGPGVTVTVEDSEAAQWKGDNPNVFLIHDDDLLRVLNELAAAGAEAMAINGQRIVATTEVRCTGPTISVNNVRIGPPYEIVAIGDPQTLEGALRMRGGVVESLEVWGIRVTIKRGENLSVPAFKGSLLFQYARPVTKEGN